MHFLRLTDDRLNVLFEDKDIIAIDKAYGFNAHTNDSKSDHADFIQDGMIEIFEKKLGQKLSVIHRLDQTTTGVMIFGKSVESAKKYAEYFFNRQVKKTYWFITKCKSTKNKFFIEKPIIHKGKELEASTHLELLNKKNGFELWQANPHTGRNHQIRIHAQEAGISILGDSNYEGHEFPFLCLHNHKIEFPNGIVITSKPPLPFENLEIFSDPILAKIYFEIDRRYRLFGHRFSESSLRWVHNQNNSLEPGFILENFESLVIMNWYKDTFSDLDFKRMQHISQKYQKTIQVRLFDSKGKPKENETIIISPSKANQDFPNETLISEGELKFKVRLLGTNLGLSLNQRLQRQWLLKNSEGKSVLCLYSGAGTMASAATLGKANSITMVEMSKGAIQISRENLELNKVTKETLTEKIKILNRDSFSFLEQCRTKKIQYELVICDTPSFYRREKGFFKFENEFSLMAENLLSILSEHGKLLFSTSFDSIYVGQIEETFLAAHKKLKIANLKISNILPSLDFELPNEKTNLKSFLIERSGYSPP